jgi:gliding motility-associated-like protein
MGGKFVNDSMLCGEAQIQLDAGTDGVFYTWTSPGDSTFNKITQIIDVPAIDPVNPDSVKYYKVVVENMYGCETADSVAIVRCIPPVSENVPIAFTPNDDGTNDTWEIPYLVFYPQASVDVYDRWGNIVFSSRGTYKPWNGMAFGKKLPMGTYYYIIKLDKKSKAIYGNVMVIR